MSIRVLIAASIAFLISASPAWAFMECFVNQDCSFLYVPSKISDGSRETTLTIATPSDDIDICWAYEDDGTCTAISEGNQTDSAPPGSGQASLTHWGNGVYRISIDASIVTESGKKLCVDVQDVQGTRTVYDEVLCTYVYPEARSQAGIAAAAATDVWAAGTRSLTDKADFGLADNAITAAKIAADAIGASEIAAGAITSSEAPNLDVAVSSVGGSSDITVTASSGNTSTWRIPIDETGVITGNGQYVGWTLVCGKVQREIVDSIQGTPDIIIIEPGNQFGTAPDNEACTIVR